MIALLLFVLVGAAMAGDFGVGLVQHEYKNCTEISPLGLVCGIIDVDPKNEWVAVKISVNNHCLHSLSPALYFFACVHDVSPAGFHSRL